MEKLKKISVIETALDQWGWSVDINEDGETLIESNVMYINGPRETDIIIHAEFTKRPASLLR